MFESVPSLWSRMRQQLTARPLRRRASKGAPPIVAEVCESRMLLVTGIDLVVDSGNLTYTTPGVYQTISPGLTFERDTSDASIVPDYMLLLIDNTTDEVRIENQGTGPGQVGVSGSAITYEGATVAFLSEFEAMGSTYCQVNFNMGVTDDAIQAIGRAYQFQAAGPITGTRSVRADFFVVAANIDGPLIETELRAISVTTAAPELSNVGPRVTYVENASPLQVWNQISLADPDSSSFENGRFVVRLSGAGGADRLGIDSIGAIGIFGDTLYDGVTLIGSFTGGQGSTPLEIEFNSSATVAAAQAVLQGITFENPSDNPSTNNRTISVQVRDTDGNPTFAAKTLRVIAVNDAPTLFGLGASPTFEEGADPVIVAPDAGFIDPDSANFDGGQLTVKIITGTSSANRLAIRNEGSGAGQVGVSGNNVTFGGVTVGTFTGGTGSTPLIITWNANALPRIARQVVRNITFENVSATPSSNDVTVQFIGTDGDGGRTDRVDQIVEVLPVANPLVIVNASDLNYPLGSTSPVRLTPSAGVSDPDGANLDGALLQVQLTSHGQTSDRLSLRNGGSAAGQVGLSGANVTYGGTTIGILSGEGTSNEGLTVTFNTSATLASVGAVLRSVLYRSTSATPDTSNRVVTYSFSDGDLLASTPVVVDINFVV